MKNTFSDYSVGDNPLTVVIPTCSVVATLSEDSHRESFHIVFYCFSRFSEEFSTSENDRTTID
jgi:hypothetical protein